ncbi:MAG: YggS family pyridoxal phosphate-dependent enzyme, partial [Oscillospiraceae bacterium]
MEKSLDEQKFYSISENLKIINENIAKAAQKSGRSQSKINFMAVTKTVEPKFINHAIDSGITLIGENKVQELLSKKDEIKLENCDVQLIGHLQTNKVKQVIDEVSMIQSVDSIHLAREISKQAKKSNITMEVLLEVNIGDEISKTGFFPAEIYEACLEIAQMEAIKIKGLMAIPPICDNNTKSRTFFSNMSKLFIDISDKKIDNVCMEILSMGMSDDYALAIEEGSNLVR